MNAAISHHFFSVHAGYPTSLEIVCIQNFIRNQIKASYILKATFLNFNEYFLLDAFVDKLEQNASAFLLCC